MSIDRNLQRVPLVDNILELASRCPWHWIKPSNQPFDVSVPEGNQCWIFYWPGVNIQDQKILVHGRWAIWGVLDRGARHIHQHAKMFFKTSYTEIDSLVDFRRNLGLCQSALLFRLDFLPFGCLEILCALHHQILHSFSYLHMLS